MTSRQASEFIEANYARLGAFAPTAALRPAATFAMKLFLSLLAVVALAIIVPLMSMFNAEPPAEAVESGLPWQVEATADGHTRVFGLTLGASTLSDAVARHPNTFEVAIITAPGKPGSLEAYAERINTGFITGKMILTLAASDNEVTAMRDRAVKTEYMESTTRRATLAPDDLKHAMTLPVRAITFIPSVQLDAETVALRFGAAKERVRMSDTLEHHLYPDRGLDIALDTKGKEVLQYVAPTDFAQLRAPLDQQGASDAGR